MPVSKTKKVIGISVVIFSVIVLHITGVFTPVEELFRAIIKPGSKTLYQWSVTIGEEYTSFSSVEELENAYKTLKEKYIEKNIQEAKLYVLQEENVQLRKQLSFFSSTTVSHIGAEVVGKNIEPLGSTLVIDKGANRNLAIGDPVIVNEGILIGIIVRVNKNTAVVKLINDNQSKIAATVANRDKSIGLVEGGYGISVRMNFIPQNEQISVGDIIITSGLSEHIPKGLLIGQIESVEKEAYQPFQEAIITPAVNLDKMDLVSVIHKTP
jgi:rod shape-determining protein MreC